MERNPANKTPRQPQLVVKPYDYEDIAQLPTRSKSNPRPSEPLNPNNKGSLKNFGLSYLQRTQAFVGYNPTTKDNKPS